MTDTVVVDNLTFSYGDKTVLKNINLLLRPGERCLLLGANGAGKSTLLKVLGGRHLYSPDESINMFGMNAFRDTRLNVMRSFLDTEWGMKTVAFAGYGVPLQADIPVSGMMTALQNQYPERRDILIRLLGIDMNWRMHMVSDGQRRRVQLFLGLLRPFKILLLDEVTVSLDVVVRQDLLQFLRQETETRGAIVVYATHIFDGLDDWPTHIHFITKQGTTGWQGPIQELDLFQQLRQNGHPSPLLFVACTWLRNELDRLAEGERKEKEGGEAAHLNSNSLTTSTVSGGGFAPGRMYDYNTGLR